MYMFSLHFFQLVSIKAISNSFNIVFGYYQLDKLIQDQVELMMYMVELLNIHFVYIFRLISEIQSLIEVLEIEKLKEK